MDSYAKIRSYENSDVLELRKLYFDYMELTAKELAKKPWHYQLDIDEIMSMTFDNLESFSPPIGQIFISTIDDVICGTASIKMIRSNVVELKRMYVNPSARGNGIGEKLVSAAMDTALKFGAKEAFLDTPPPFKAAHRLYRRLGFNWTTEYPEVGIPEELKFDWLYMHKRLT